jgi:hypothetical protein
MVKRGTCKRAYRLKNGNVVEEDVPLPNKPRAASSKRQATPPRATELVGQRIYRHYGRYGNYWGRIDSYDEDRQLFKVVLDTGEDYEYGEAEVRGWAGVYLPREIVR